MSSQKRNRASQRPPSIRQEIRADPRLAVLLGFIALPVVFYPWTFDPVAIPRLAALLSLGTVAATAIMVERSSICWRAPWLWAVGSLALAFVLSWMASVDRKNAVLGNVGYRFGLVTWIALCLGFTLAAVVVRRNEQLATVLRGGLAVGALVATYALVQGLGADPFDWSEEWDRAFSTLGNPNDLAAFGVLAIAFVGGLPGVSHRRIGVGVASALIVIAGVVVLSGSRSGLLALFVGLVVALVFCRRGGWPAGQQHRLVAVLGAMAVFGIGVAAATGELADIISRTRSTFDGTSPQGLSTRAAIWEGSASAYVAHPVFGVGPDGLLSDFGRHQPADLGYPFDVPTRTGFDPLVASPHSAPLEILITAGPLALVAGLLIVSVCAAAMWRVASSPHLPAMSFVAGGLAAFVTIAMVNPLSIGTAAPFVVLLGCTAGLAGGTPAAFPSTRNWRPTKGTLVAVTFAVVPALAFASLLLAADRSAYRAGLADAKQHDRAASGHAHRAARLIPMDIAYARLEAQTRANAALASGDLGAVADAERLQTRFVNRFAVLPSDYLFLARLRMIIGAPGIQEAITAALHASPHGIDTANSIKALQEASRIPTDR